MQIDFHAHFDSCDPTTMSAACRVFGILGCLTILAAAKTAVAGLPDTAMPSGGTANLIPYSGFDTGVYRRWRTSYQSGCVVRDADLDSSFFHDGTHSLRLYAYDRGFIHTPAGTEAESAFVIPLDDEPRTYTLSAWVRADARLDFVFGCGQLAISELLEPDEGWRRLSASGTLTGEQRLNLSVRARGFDPATLHGGTVWVDSLQLEAGTDATAWKASRFEAGLVSKVPFSVFHSGDQVRLTLHLSGPPPARDCRLRIVPSLFDAFGNREEMEEIEITIGAGSGTTLSVAHDFDFPSDRTGIFRLVTEISGGEAAGLGDQRIEAPFYVLPRADPDAWNPIGLYAQMNRPMIELAGRLNLFWNNLLSSAGEMVEWHKVWRDGQTRVAPFVPRLKWAADNCNMRFIGCIGPSSILDRLPAEMFSETAQPDATITLSPSALSTERRHLRLEPLYSYLKTISEAYSPHVRLWQIVDECAFPDIPYSRLCAEAGRALRLGNRDAVPLATYPHLMAHAWLHGGEEACGGLYHLGRTPRNGQAALEAASLAGPDFPVYFYDCSIRFSYFSDTFNGWGKLALSAPPATVLPHRDCVADFENRLDEALSRQLHPLGTGGRNVRALSLYHARMPGGRSLCATDAWGHPAPLLVACGIFNALTPGGSEDPISLDAAYAYRFSRGAANGHLVALHAKGGSGARSLDLGGLEGVRALDIWGNETGDGNAPVWLATNRWLYLTIPADGLMALTERLRATFGEAQEERLDWPEPLSRSVVAHSADPVLHLTMEPGSDNLLRDLSQTNRILAGVGREALTDGLAGYALDTAQTQPKIPDDDFLAVGERGLTVCCWIRPSTNTVRWASFVKKDARAPGQTFEPTAYRPFIGWNFGTTGSSAPVVFEQASFRFDIAGEGGSGRVTAGPISMYAATNVWTHLAATYNPAADDRGLRLYVNGILVADSVVVKQPRSIDNQAPLTIGRDLRPFNGALDNIRVYNHALDAAAVSAIFEQEKSSATAEVTMSPAPW